jgi:hypothetical protein
MAYQHRVKAAFADVTIKDGRMVVKTVIPGRMLTPLEVMAHAGELGDEVAKLLGAAAWFGEMATTGNLRGRLSRSSFTEADATRASEQAAALHQLAHAYDAIGPDSWNVLVNCVVWENPPTATQQPLLRAALHGLASWRQRHKKTP